MKSAGMVRKVDELGRIVIPMQLRRILDIDKRDGLEFYTDGNKVILKKYEPGCALCGNSDTLLTEWKGHLVCKSCVQGLKQLSPYE